MTVIASIDLKALSHNLDIVRQHSSAKIIAMVKANAYGHGLLPVARFLEKKSLVEMFAVANLEEALSLREAGIQKTILIMMGFLNEDELLVAANHGFHVVVHRAEQIDLLESLSGEAISVWLKLDLGMHRLGFLPSEAESVYQRLQACTGMKKPLHFMTHFPSGDLHSSQSQAAQFNDITKEWIGEKSLSNSVSVLTHSLEGNDWIRPGIMLYGASPCQQTAAELNLKPVMTLRAPIIAIRYLKKDDAIGYDGTWICPEDMPLAIVGIGYGDGYPRHAKSGTPILIRGKRAPLVGRVSMNMIAVDLRDIEIPEIGEEVILWGEGLPAEVVAEYAGTLSYELFCRLSSTVKCQYDQ
jgi:alanine racemase